MVSEAELRRAETRITALEERVQFLEKANFSLQYTDYTLRQDVEALKLDILKIAQTHVDTLKNQADMLSATNHLLDCFGVPSIEEIEKRKGK